MMPLRPDPTSLSGAPDVDPALVGLGVAAATAVDCDGDVEFVVADDNGRDEALACVLAVGVEEGEGVALLLPVAVALMLRLTPTPPQICCAKDMTSVEKGIGSVSTFVRKSLRKCWLFLSERCRRLYVFISVFSFWTSDSGY